jgi:hypothetical protein
MPPLWKHHAQGRIACRLNLVLKPHNELDTHYLCAEFEVCGGAAQIDACGFDALEGAPLKREPLCSHEDRGIDAMLVPVGEDAKDREGVHSIVRLKPLDDFPVFRPHVFEGVGFVEITRRDVPLKRLVEYGESSPSRSGSLEFSSIGLDDGELPYQMVQHATQVVANVPYEDASASHKRLWDFCNPEDIIARTRLVLGTHSYSVLLGPNNAGFNLGLQGVSMLHRPVELGPTPGEIGLVGHD